MRSLLLATAALLALGACAPGAAGGSPIRIFAASSLQDALPALAGAYAADGVAIRPAFDASSRLRVQIEQGAEADLFLSADARNIDLLAAGEIGIGGGIDYAANRLVLIAPADSTTVTDWRDLAAPGVRILAAADEVPIARYTATLIDRLAALESAPTGFAAAHAANVVSLEDNVRAVLAKVEIGEADAAFVYASDASASDRVRVIALPDEVAVRAVYRGLVIAEKGANVAGAFLAWLAGPEARPLLAAFGFEAP